MSVFSQTIKSLPYLGVGLSGEYNSASKGIDPFWMHDEHPGLVHFFEYGCDIDRGLDEAVRRWSAGGRPTTYHFLDVNLEDRADLDDRWIDRTKALAEEIQAAWLCGDAGRWHFGPRERGHQLLLPPILCRESALECADSLAFLQERIGKPCLPENPPATVYLGDLHILDYYALVTERADCGMLLDCAHLAIFQHLRGLPPTAGLDGFPLDRIVEVHIAGGTLKETEGYAYIDDSHAAEPLAAVWEIFEYVRTRATNLRAVVYECEFNRPEACLATFARLNRAFPPQPPV